jgi:hypothetical protein
MLAVTASAFLVVTWVATKGLFFFLQGVANPLKATVEEFTRTYEAASPDEQAELRFWPSSALPRRPPGVEVGGSGTIC